MTYEVFIQYIKPELIVVAIILYCIGIALKNSKLVKDEYIPFILGIVGIVFAMLYVFATSPVTSGQEVLSAIFVSLTQGILCAAASVYINQIIKQATGTSSKTDKLP